MNGYLTVLQRAHKPIQFITETLLNMIYHGDKSEDYCGTLQDSIEFALNLNAINPMTVPEIEIEIFYNLLSSLNDSCFKREKWANKDDYVNFMAFKNRLQNHLEDLNKMHYGDVITQG